MWKVKIMRVQIKKESFFKYWCHTFILYILSSRAGGSQPLAVGWYVFGGEKMQGNMENVNCPGFGNT